MTLPITGIMDRSNACALRMPRQHNRHKTVLYVTIPAHAYSTSTNTNQHPFVLTYSPSTSIFLHVTVSDTCSYGPSQSSPSHLPLCSHVFAARPIALGHEDRCSGVRALSSSLVIRLSFLLRPPYRINICICIHILHVSRQVISPVPITTRMAPPRT